MQAVGIGTKAWLLSSALMIGLPILGDSAHASSLDRHAAGQIPPNLHTRLAGFHAPLAAGPRISSLTNNRTEADRQYGISCVPYARQISGIQVTGNAWQWWDNAAGVYSRGDRPEPGSVLNFRPNGRMHLGHVAVVKRVVNAREVIIDHANWPNGRGPGTVSHNVAVVDVSEANNWSAVRVQIGQGGEFGSVYPTYGFIYNRPDTGVILTAVTRPTPPPAINRVPSDLRPVAERPWRTSIIEVAESPQAQAPSRRFGLIVPAAD